MRKLLMVLSLCFVVCSCSEGAESIVLYDGSLNEGIETPSAQGWLYIADPIFGSFASQNASGGVTTLNTMTYASIMAGYFNQDPSGLSGYIHPAMSGIVLDRQTGFSLDFSVKINSESHSYNDRAGFSFLVITADLMGIELGFWENEVWAQSDNPLFTHAESANISAYLMNEYTLEVLNGAYSLYVDNVLALTGDLRNYSSWVNPLDGGHKPYDIPNFLFFGDNTSSAKSSVSISKIEMNINSVPEPSALFFFLSGIICLVFGKKRLAE